MAERPMRCYACSMHDSARLANLLGAAALGLTDVVLAAVRAAGATSISGDAALVVLSTSPGLSVTELGRHVGLTQSAAARMVDSLAAAGLVRREPAAGRAVAVVLTANGHRTAARLLAARSARLDALIATLPDADQRVLEGLLESLLTGLYSETGDAALLCRLCDRAGCVRDAPCPVGAAEFARAAERDRG